MLVLTRKLDESIIVDNNIEIKILKIQGGQVHVGVKAPREISVYRSEIYEMVKNQNKNAVQVDVDGDKLRKLEENLGAFRKLMGLAGGHP